LLKPNGYLILTTQDKFVFRRRPDVVPLKPGHIRRWLSTREVRKLVRSHFRIGRVTTIVPEGHLGILRIINSHKLTALLERLGVRTYFDSLKERMGLGQTIVVLAQRKD
jgi:hypothetical protein